MNIELKYFTGTGNSLKVLNTCKEVFEQNKHFTKISKINIDENHIGESGILGFCFPVYAFGIPRICRRYLKSIVKFNNRQKVFVLITAGDSDESGFSLKECTQILSKKNCDIVYSGVIQMPINWTTSPVPPFPPSKEEAIEIIQVGVAKAKIMACEIISGISKHHEFNYPGRFTKLRFYRDYWLFKYIGVSNMWRNFKTYNTCNGCHICSEICPAKSIYFKNNKPVWTSSCEQCMRCVNFCPKEAIYQTMGGDTIGKNKYHEPGFEPHINDYI